MNVLFRVFEGRGGGAANHNLPTKFYVVKLLHHFFEIVHSITKMGRNETKRSDETDLTPVRLRLPELNAPYSFAFDVARERINFYDKHLSLSTLRAYLSR